MIGGRIPSFPPLRPLFGPEYLLKNLNQEARHFGGFFTSKSHHDMGWTTFGFHETVTLA